MRKYTNLLLLLLAILFYHTVSNELVKQNYKLDFYTQYNQFYLCDKKSPKLTNAYGFWSAEAYKDRLAVESGVLGVGTYSYGRIRCEISISNKVNSRIDLLKYDHVVEAGIDVSSGVLQVMDCPNNEVELEVKLRPGKYRVRVYSWGLSGNDIDENEANDRYKIEIWPDSNMERTVLKRYPRNKE